MGFKSILVPFLDEQSARPAFAAAALLARESKGHIFCVHIRQRPVPSTTIIYPLGGVYTTFTQEFQETENKLANDLRQLFTSLCTEEAVATVAATAHSSAKGATASWRDEEDDLFLTMPASGMTCDLAILSAGGDKPSPLATMLAEEMLFQSGRPVLLVPSTGLTTAPKRIVVAWNGRQEAARAVSAGLDLLRKADAVRVLTVRKAQTPAVNTDDLTIYLRLHNVEATQTEIELVENEVETEKLDEEIREFGADLLIMGAYSHSRWREAILGGYTRHVLKHSNIPVFMSQ